MGCCNRDLFTKLGMKHTKHRCRIYDILLEAELPLSPEEIYLKMKAMDATVSFSTVYRTLDAFAEKGVAIRTVGEGEGKSAAFELNRGEHRHRLVCIGCKRVVPLDGCPLEGFEEALAKATQFDIAGHRLEVFGYCPECKSKS